MSTISIKLEKKLSSKLIYGVSCQDCGHPWGTGTVMGMRGASKEACILYFSIWVLVHGCAHLTKIHWAISLWSVQLSVHVLYCNSYLIQRCAMDTRESTLTGIREICSREAMPVTTRPNILGDGSVPRARLTEPPHSPSLSILPTLSSVPKSVSSWWRTPQHQLLPSSPLTPPSVIQTPLSTTFCVQGAVYWDTKRSRTQDLPKGLQWCLCKIRVSTCILSELRKF